MKKENKVEVKEEPKGKGYIIFLIIAFISFIAYLVLEIINYDSFLNFLPKLLGIIFIFLFLVCFTVLSIKSKDKRSGTIIIGSLIITLYSIFNILLSLNVLKLPSDEFVPNFYDKDLEEVITWKDSNNIIVNVDYEYSDNILKDHVISQDVNYPALTKNTKELRVIVSLGPDYAKEIIVPSFIGLKFDEVFKYIEENHLSNVKVNFQKDNDNIDKVISQSGNGTIKRNSEIILTFGISDEETGNIKIIDFTNKSVLYATSWLKKYNFKTETLYEFSDTVKKDYVINQSVKNEEKNPEEDTITLTISKGKQTNVPDILDMNVDEINKWVKENDLKVSYTEEYSDEVTLGDVINSSVKKDDTVSSGDTVNITISRGTLKMPKLTNLDTFKNWASNNDVKYDIAYENNSTVKKDDIIKCSHKEGDIIKKDDTVVITVSKGKSVTVPNFVGSSKSSIQNTCSSLNINCTFKNGGHSDKYKKDYAISQSKKAGSTITEGASVVISLSIGPQQKVNVPSFKGKTKSTIELECKKIGITCKFNYQSGYSNDAKDTAVSQSKSGEVVKGSTITINLSNGPAKTYTVIIDANQLSNGNAQATKATLEAKLKTACPGVTFKFTYQKANSGIGYLAQNSQVKVGSNKLTQGKTYNVIINSN